MHVLATICTSSTPHAERTDRQGKFTGEENCKRFVAADKTNRLSQKKRDERNWHWVLSAAEASTSDVLQLHGLATVHVRACRRSETNLIECMYSGAVGICLPIQYVIVANLAS